MDSTFQRVKSDIASNNWQNDCDYYPETKLHNRKPNTDIFSVRALKMVKYVVSGQIEIF